MKPAGPATLIDLDDRSDVLRRTPLIIAHRGGVVTAASPGNTLAAIRLAATDGYDMVELDVAIASDDEPILFHGSGAERTMQGTSAGDTPVAAFSSRELAKIQYTGSDERIAMLDEALALCRTLGLGIMLDIKFVPGTQPSRRGVERIAQLLRTHGLATATMTITPHPLVLEMFPRDVYFPIGEEAIGRVAAGSPPPLSRAFWFGIPAEMPENLIGPVQAAGALVIPAINQHRYPPERHRELARQDIRRLRAIGVDGFQIDSIYREALAQGN